MKTFKGTKREWVKSEYIGITDKSNVLSPVYYQNVCTKRHPSGIIIAKCLSKDKEILKANAKLIAASPELLEALIDMIDLFEKEKFIDCEIEKGNFNRRISKAKKAINKAL